MSIKINGNEIRIPKIQKVVVGTQDRTGDIVYENDCPFYVEAIEACSITARKSTAASVRTIVYIGINSKTAATQTWEATSDNTTIPLSAGDRAYFWATTTLFKLAGTAWSSTGKFKIGGNVQSLVNYSTNAVTNFLKKMFYNNTYLISASSLKLTATTVGTYAYQSMFQGCTNLKYGPSLIGASTLGTYACNIMFQDCTSLITAPGEIKATAYATQACSGMFYNCISLTTIPKMTIESITGGQAFKNMFYNCTALPRLDKQIKINAAVLNYERTFQNTFTKCTSLTLSDYAVENLFSSITTVTGNCALGGIFEYCSSIVECPKLNNLTTLSGTGGLLDYFVRGCTSLKIPHLPPKVKSVPGKAYTHFFYECTSLDKLPKCELTSVGPYTDDNSAFGYMFASCPNIKISTTYDASLYPNTYKIPFNGTYTSTYAQTSAFSGTGGSYTGDLMIGTPYYTSNEIVD